MARETKSLIHNLEDGKDIRRHREHRSKGGRKPTRRGQWTYLIYKAKLKELQELEWKQLKKSLISLN